MALDRKSLGTLTQEHGEGTDKTPSPLNFIQKKKKNTKYCYITFDTS